MIISIQKSTIASVGIADIVVEDADGTIWPHVPRVVGITRVRRVFSRRNL